MLVSEEQWKSSTSLTAKALRALLGAQKALSAAGAYQVNSIFTDWIVERVSELQRGEFNTHAIRLLNSHVKGLESDVRRVLAAAGR